MAEVRLAPDSALGALPGRRPPGGAGLWVVCALVAYVLFWAVARDLMNYNLDRHADMVENFAWGIGWQLGYYKHPPLFAWITAAWFEVFPRTNLSYFVLASANVAVAGFFMWRISRRFLSEWQQIIAVLLLFLLPLLSFHAMTYNANSGMLPFWALALLFYLRTLERRAVGDAALTGVFCGLAILTKYHSAVLVLALAAHAMLDRDARPLLRSALPWVAMLAGALVIAPHVAWMVGNDFITITYAAEQGDGHFATALVSVFKFLGSFVLLALPGVIVVALYWRRSDGLAPRFPVAWRAWSGTPAGRALIFATLGSLVFTVVLALLDNAKLSSFWATPIFIFAPIFLAALVTPERAAERPLIAPPAIFVFCVVLLALAPFLRERTMASGVGNTGRPIAEIARQVEATWHRETGAPLSIVASSEYFLSSGTAFYAADRPQAVQLTLELTPWVTRQDIERLGAVFICPVFAAGEACDAAAADQLGRIDARLGLTVPAVPGAAGPARWEHILYLRRPAAPSA